MAGFERDRMQSHFSFFGSSVPFPVITGSTGTDKIFPGIISTPGFRDNMINGQWQISPSAVGTPVCIPSQNIFSAQYYFFIRQADESAQPYHARPRVDFGHCLKRFSFIIKNQFSLPQDYQDNSLLNIADG